MNDKIKLIIIVLALCCFSSCDKINNEIEKCISLELYDLEFDDYQTLYKRYESLGYKPGTTNYIKKGAKFIYILDFDFEIKKLYICIRKKSSRNWKPKEIHKLKRLLIKHYGPPNNNEWVIDGTKIYFDGFQNEQLSPMIIISY